MNTTLVKTRNQALWAWILEFEISVHRICKFDSFWTDLIQIKSKNKMAIFILFINVTTFYSNIFWFVQPFRSFFLQKDTQKDTHSLRQKPHRWRRSNSSLDIQNNLSKNGLNILGWLNNFGKMTAYFAVVQTFWTSSKQFQTKTVLHITSGLQHKSYNNNPPLKW